MSADKSDAPILRFGDWVEQNGFKYTSTLRVVTPTFVANGASYDIKFNEVNHTIMDVYGFTRLVKDYDKYIDANLHL